MEHLVDQHSTDALPPLGDGLSFGSSMAPAGMQPRVAQLGGSPRRRYYAGRNLARASEHRRPAGDGPRAAAALRARIPGGRRGRRGEPGARPRRLCAMALRAAPAGGRLAAHAGQHDPRPARPAAARGRADGPERPVHPPRRHRARAGGGAGAAALRAEHDVQRPDGGRGAGAQPAPLVAAVRLRRRGGVAGAAAARRCRRLRSAGGHHQCTDLRPP